jgi:hypothetical protein
MLVLPSKNNKTPALVKYEVDDIELRATDEISGSE